MYWWIETLDDIHMIGRYMVRIEHAYQGCVKIGTNADVRFPQRWYCNPYEALATIVKVLEENNLPIIHPATKPATNFKFCMYQFEGDQEHDRVTATI